MLCIHTNALQFTIQLALRAGLNVYGVASEVNLGLVQGLGATPISRTNKNLDEIVEEVRKTSSDSIKYVIDLIGIESSNAALKLLKHGGAIAPLASMTLGKDARVPEGVDVHIIEMKRWVWLSFTYESVSNSIRQIYHRQHL